MERTIQVPENWKEFRNALDVRETKQCNKLKINYKKTKTKEL